MILAMKRIMEYSVSEIVFALRDGSLPCVDLLDRACKFVLYYLLSSFLPVYIHGKRSSSSPPIFIFPSQPKQSSQIVNGLPVLTVVTNETLRKLIDLVEL